MFLFGFIFYQNVKNILIIYQFTNLTTQISDFTLLEKQYLHQITIHYL
jgi:hypothetical protein